MIKKNGTHEGKIMNHDGWSNATPIFRVRDLRASVDHYVRVLGFAIDWNAGGLASVSRGRCSIFLCEGDQSCPRAWAWIGCDDVVTLHEELAGRGATIRHPPTHHPWAYEMQVSDPDGNVLRLGSDANEDEPEGEWLDASGRRWRKSSDGTWTVVEV